MSQAGGIDRRQFIERSVVAAAGISGSSASAQTTAAASRPVFLLVYRPGPRWIPGKPNKEQPLKEHFRYMLDLYQRGLLRFAGGFADGNGGAAMFEAQDDAEAQAVAAADPAVVSEVFVFELRRWTLIPWASLPAPQR